MISKIAISPHMATFGMMQMGTTVARTMTLKKTKMAHNSTKCGLWFVYVPSFKVSQT